MATFGASNITSIGIRNSSISSFLFNAGAPAYTFTDTDVFTINGQGIINNSSFAPTFINNATLSFVNSSKAGNATITGGGGLQFSDTSTAGNASINYSGIVNFLNTSTAGNASIINGYTTFFLDSSTAGKASIANNHTIAFRGGSTAGNSSIINNNFIEFSGTSTAGNATIINNSPLFSGSDLTFLGNSNPGHARNHEQCWGRCGFFGHQGAEQ